MATSAAAELAMKIDSKTRRRRQLWCAGILVGAAVTAGIASRLETFGYELSVDHAPIAAAVGIGPAVFVTLFTAGTFAFAHTVGYRRRALWITTVLLFTYLGLKTLVWQRAYRITVSGQEAVVVDGDTPLARPGSGNSLVLLTTTVGLLCFLRALVDMRRALHVPVRVRKSAGDVGEPEPGDEAGAVEGEVVPPSLDRLDQRLSTPAPEPPALSDLDAALPAPEGAPPPAPPEVDVARIDSELPEPPARDRRKRPLFE